jgi:hypothetical protein
MVLLKRLLVLLHFLLLLLSPQSKINTRRDTFSTIFYTTLSWSCLLCNSGINLNEKKYILIKPLTTLFPVWMTRVQVTYSVDLLWLSRPHPLAHEFPLCHDHRSSRDPAEDVVTFQSWVRTHRQFHQCIPTRSKCDVTVRTVWATFP